MMVIMMLVITMMIMMMMVIMMITMMVMAIFTWISVDGVCTKAAKRVTLDRQYSRGRSWIRIIINDNDTDDDHHHHQ